MTPFSIQLSDARRAFLPRENLGGAVSWNLPAPPHAVEIRLLWFTQGKGTTDREIVDKQTFASPSAVGDARFSFELPRAPHSFSGQLISLVWAIEATSLKPPALVRLGSGDEFVERCEFILGFGAQEIELRAVEVPKSEAQSRFDARKLAYWRRKESPLASESPWSDPKTGK